LIQTENELLPVNHNEWNVVLGTDDDGIWSCDYHLNGEHAVSLYGNVFFFFFLNLG